VNDDATQRKQTAILAVKRMERQGDCLAFLELLEAVHAEQLQEMEQAESTADMWRAQGAARMTSTLFNILQGEAT
jgi:hypothetical protein